MGFVRHTHAVEQMYKNMDKIISSGILSGKTVMTFGTSKIAGMMIHYFRENTIFISASLDNDIKRQGETVFGVKVYPPAVLVDMEKENVIVLIASSFQDAMQEQLIHLGLPEQNSIKVVDLPELMSDYSFVDRTGYIEMTDEEVRQAQLGVLRHLKKVCQEHGLHYFLSGGTLLGAVRHKGYIPWDDDIDIYMDIRDIQKLAAILRTDEQFTLISFLDPESDYYDDGSLLFDNSTVCDSNHFPMQVSMGVSIDIFPLSALPNGQEEVEEYTKTIKRLESEKWGVLYDTEKLKQANQKMIDYLLQFDYDHAEKIGYVLGRHFKRDIHKKELFAAAVPVEFEGEYFAAPVGYDAFLKSLYGNYMELPPVEQRKPHHYFKAYHKK